MQLKKYQLSFYHLKNIMEITILECMNDNGKI